MVTAFSDLGNSESCVNQCSWCSEYVILITCRNEPSLGSPILHSPHWICVRFWTKDVTSNFLLRGLGWGQFGPGSGSGILGNLQNPLEKKRDPNHFAVSTNIPGFLRWTLSSFLSPLQESEPVQCVVSPSSRQSYQRELSGILQQSR